MGQQEVLKEMQKSKEWLSAKEVSKIVGTSSNNVSQTLRKLYNQGLLLRLVCRDKDNHFLYRWKIK